MIQGSENNVSGQTRRSLLSPKTSFGLLLQRSKYSFLLYKLWAKARWPMVALLAAWVFSLHALLSSNLRGHLMTNPLRFFSLLAIETRPPCAFSLKIVMGDGSDSRRLTLHGRLFPAPPASVMKTLGKCFPWEGTKDNPKWSYCSRTVRGESLNDPFNWLLRNTSTTLITNTFANTAWCSPSKSPGFRTSGLAGTITKLYLPKWPNVFHSVLWTFKNGTR